MMTKLKKNTYCAFDFNQTQLFTQSLFEEVREIHIVRNTHFDRKKNDHLMLKNSLKSC
jgi:hypothetical protein